MERYYCIGNKDLHHTNFFLFRQSKGVKFLPELFLTLVLQSGNICDCC